jgi:hypothetical protein
MVIPALPVALPPGLASAARGILRVVRTALIILVLGLVLGNVIITGAWKLQAHRADPVTLTVAGLPNLHVVDGHVWRSGAPAANAYDDLADAGVTAIVDLRAEEDVHVDARALDRMGITYTRLAIRDGQTPTHAQVATFLATVRGNGDGITLVHCGAGVGRTGAMVAAYLVASGEATGRGAMQRNLAIGPPSLEQLAFAARLDSGVGHPPALVTAVSRVLDAPRRLWSRYGL